MFYLRRKSDSNYLYYLNGDSTSMSQKIKDAIPFYELETAQCMKRQIEKMRDEKFEIVEVKTTITICEENNQEILEDVQ